MNDFHETEKETADAGKTESGHIDLRYAQSAEKLPTKIEPTEDPGDHKFLGGVGLRRAVNQQTILYVDSNPKALRMLKFVIEGSGYKVVTACNAPEMSERMQQSRCDLVLVSYRTLKMMGPEQILAIKRPSPRTPIILISGSAFLSEQELSHVDAHVGKGETLDILMGKIRALVVAHESSRASASGPLEKPNEIKLSA